MGRKSAVVVHASECPLARAPTSSRSLPAQAREQGALIVFPSILYHAVAPVTTGVRRSLVGWYSGPPVVEYSREFQARAADDLDLLPEESAMAEMLSDYAVMREQVRACRAILD